MSEKRKREVEQIDCSICKSKLHGTDIEENYKCDICDKVYCYHCFYNVEHVVNLGNGGDYCIECYATVWMGWSNNK